MIKSMIRLVAVLSVTTLLSFQVMAHEGFELGIGVGNTHATSPDDFRIPAQQGDAQLYWLGYGLNKNWGAELGYDALDFDGVDSKMKAVSLSAVYTFFADYAFHPIAKLGLGSSEVTNALDTKETSLHGKGAFGLEYDCKYVSVGALFNYFHVTKAQETPTEIKNAGVVVPALYLTIHEAVEHESRSRSEAPQAAAAPIVKDTDADGISDDQDKCPNTPANTVVNGFGCAVTEKASVKLAVEFASGKSTLDSRYADEIKSLADFMAKFPETKIEIAGHTDNTGSVAVNKSLSQKRAEAVKAALVKEGVEASRLTAKGYGSAQPVADNSTVEGRQTNRRVMAEISVVTEKKK